MFYPKKRKVLKPCCSMKGSRFILSDCLFLIESVKLGLNGLFYGLNGKMLKY